MSDISPDGKWAFYISSGIRKVPVAGGEPVTLPTGYNPQQPSVSPDGKLIAYYYREKQMIKDIFTSATFAARLETAPLGPHLELLATAVHLDSVTSGAAGSVFRKQCNGGTQ